MCKRCEIAAVALGKDDIRGKHQPEEMNRAINLLTEVIADFVGAMSPEIYAKWQGDFEALVRANREWRVQAGEDLSPGAMTQ